MKTVHFIDFPFQTTQLGNQDTSTTVRFCNNLLSFESPVSNKWTFATRGEGVRTQPVAPLSLRAGLYFSEEMFVMTLSGSHHQNSSEDDFRSGCRNVSQCHHSQDYTHQNVHNLPTYGLIFYSIN